MRMESEELRNLPLHMQEQVGVALAEQMEQAAPVAEEEAPTSGIAIASMFQCKTYGDYVRSMDDAQLADMLVEIQLTSVRNMLKELETGAEQWKKEIEDSLKADISY